MRTDYLTVKEVARLLRVPESAIYALVHYDEIPSSFVGRRVRIPARALERWLRRGGTAARETRTPTEKEDKGGE